MDIPEKFLGYTYMALRVASIRSSVAPGKLAGLSAAS
jgi:hypothetical protein